MPDWMLYTIIGFAVLLLVLLIVLIVSGKLVFGGIEMGWPPKIKLVPKGGGSAVAGSKDEVTAKNKGKVGNVEIEGAAQNTSFKADGGEIGDVKVKRKF